MAGEPNHLSPAALTIANLPWLERLAHMHGRWGDRPAPRRSGLRADRRRLHVRAGPHQAADRLIVGPTNNGKGMITETFRHLHTRARARATGARSCRSWPCR